MAYIENFGDDPCEECEEQIGKKARVSADVTKHPNCKCLVVEDISNSEEQTMETAMDKKTDTAIDTAIDAAEAEAEIAKQVDALFDTGTAEVEGKHIIDDGAHGEIEVQIAPIGKFKGSRADGSAVEEDLTKESLDKLAEDLNRAGSEVLVDVDHKSTKPGPDKDSAAAGWLSGFFTTVKGLFAKMKLTKKGRELVESREYRKLSPVFGLDENGIPVKLHSVAMTNTPALDNEAILNSAPVEAPVEAEASTETETESIEDTIQKEETMTKEEIVELIKAVVAEMNASKEAKELKEEVKEDIREAVEDTSYNACSGDSKAKKEAANEAPVEAKTEEAKEPVKKDKELISEEVLNSAPTPQAEIAKIEAWRGLTGKAFWDYLKAHPECR